MYVAVEQTKSYVLLQLCQSIFPGWFYQFTSQLGEYKFIFFISLAASSVVRLLNFSSLMGVNILINFLIDIPWLLVKLGIFSQTYRIWGFLSGELSVHTICLLGL